MKKWIIILLLLFNQGLFAQTWSEWFDQKSTQKKYLLQQIVALKIYAGYAAKGYGIVKNGLGVIGKIRHGDFSMHSDYFSSLSRVNPLVRKYSKVLAIFSMQISMIKQANILSSKYLTAKQSTAVEQRYIQEVVANILADIEVTRAELVRLINPNNLQMKDDERVNVINQLYADTQDQQTFLGYFSQSSTILDAQRSWEENNISRLKILNGLP